MVRKPILRPDTSLIVALLLCLPLFALLPLSAWAQAQTSSPFPDTGQNRCYNDTVQIPCPASGDFYGQDAQYQPRLPRSYVKLGNGGVELATDALHVDDDGPWIMTRDNVTGLIWEVKSADENSVNYKNLVYQGRFAQNDFIEVLNADSFGGFSDWRMPSVTELASLVHAGAFNPTVNQVFFPNTYASPDEDPGPVSGYWTDTESNSTSGFLWLVNFYWGGTPPCESEEESKHVRAVRGTPLPASFTDNNDGTVTDAVTGLMWQKCSFGQTWDSSTQCTGTPTPKTWKQALSAMEALSFAGHDDWRLPNVNELQSLVDYSASNPAIDGLFPLTSSGVYWTSTTRDYNKARAWTINFATGQVGHDGIGKSESHYVRAVRMGRTDPVAEIKYDNAASVWDGDNLKVFIRYTVPLMQDVSGVNKNYFLLSDGNGPNLNPDTVQSENHELTLEFSNYPVSATGAEYTVSYTDDPSTGRLKDVFGNDAQYPDSAVAYVPEKGAGPGSEKWRFQVGSSNDVYVRSSPALSADADETTVFFGANDGKVYALNTANGMPQWIFSSASSQPIRSSPAVDNNGNIYVGGNDKKMYAIDGATGTKLWEVGTGGHIWSSPAIGTDGTVYFGVNDHILDAYHGNGTLRWSVSLSSEVISSPAIFNDHVYVGTYDGKLHARDVQTGNVKQGFPFQASWIIYSSPAIGADGTIYFASTDGNVYALNPDGSEKWRRSLGSSTFVFSSPALGYYNLYIGCNDGKLHALRQSNGELRWSYPTGGPVMSTPAVAARDSSDELIYVGSYDKYLYAINQDGDLAWRFQTAGPIYASPNVGQDGTIYVGSHDGRFYAVNGDPNYVLQSYYTWPKFSRDAQNSGRFTTP